MIEIIASFPIWVDWILCLTGLWLLNMPDYFYSVTISRGGIHLVLGVIVSLLGLLLFAFFGAPLIVHYVDLFMTTLSLQ